MQSRFDFWANFSVQTAVALATSAAAFVALYGPRLQRRLFPPALRLRLLDRRGEKTTVPIGWTDKDGTEHTRQESARFYHVTISNAAPFRWPPATGVELHLKMVEVKGPDGQFHTTWTGDLPMRRRFQEFKPLAATVGASTDYDIGNVVKGKWVELLPLFVPNNLQVRWREAMHIRIQLQAQSLEVDSPTLTIEIAWDRQWDDDADVMATHMVVKEVVQVAALA